MDPAFLINARPDLFDLTGEPPKYIVLSRQEVLEAILERAKRTSKKIFGYDSVTGKVSEAGNRNKLRKAQVETWDRICCEGDNEWTPWPDPPVVTPPKRKPNWKQGYDKPKGEHDEKDRGYTKGEQHHDGVRD